MQLIHDFLTVAASKVPEKIAIISDQGSITYRELLAQTDNLALWLLNRGVKQGDRVIITLPNSIPVVSIINALSKIGAIFVVVNSDVKDYQLGYIINDCKPKMVITDKEHLSSMGHYQYYSIRIEVVEEIVEEIKNKKNTLPTISIYSSDISSLLYTSGSTGSPKAILSSHNNTLFCTRAIQMCLKIESGDVIGCFLPLSFDYGLYQTFLTFQVGATLVLMDYKQAGLQLLKNITKYKITGLPVVPNLALNLIKLLNRSYKTINKTLDQLRFITNTGAKLPRSYILELQKLLPNCNIFLMYGLTECKRVSILDAGLINAKMDSVGKPLPGTKCWIVDDENDTLPSGEVGELVVKGPHVMQGYWGDQLLTQKKFRAWGKDEETVLYTGDLFSMDTDGFLYFHGRRDDIFKSHGFRLNAIEIENAALDIMEVEQAALLFNQMDSRTVLLVVVKEKITQLKLKKELGSRLEQYKVPSRIQIVSTFPLLPSGKVDKGKLMNMYF